MKFCPLIENSLLPKVVPANDSKHCKISPRKNKDIKFKTISTYELLGIDNIIHVHAYVTCRCKTVAEQSKLYGGCERLTVII